MYCKEKLLDLKERMQNNLVECILPVWRDHSLDKVNGGFLGKINEDLTPDYTYPKAVVLMTRELWTFCNAYRLLKDERYAELAKLQFEFLCDYFWDKDFGGVYFMINPEGKALNVEKRTYAQAFIIFSMAEYYLTFKDKKALQMAMFTFNKVNESLKYTSGGYVDTTGRDWVFDPLGVIWWMNPTGAPLLLNSHLHLFEAVISLYKATGDENVRNTLHELMLFLVNTVYDRDLHHLKAGMDYDGTRLDDEICYGHDAECSYLLTQGAGLLGDKKLTELAKTVAIDMMSHTLEEGIDTKYGGLYFDYHFKSGVMNRCKIWWCQAEAITAFINAYELSLNEKFLDAAIGIWTYVENNLVDHKYGEWYANGPYTYNDPADIQHQKARAKRVGREKASRVKCPYHNSRTCMEIIQRVDAMISENETKADT